MIKRSIFMRAGLCVLISSAVMILFSFSGGDGGNAQAAANTPAASAGTPSLSLAAQVGKKLFFDQTLSGSGKMSCASCHDPNFAYGPPNNLAAQLGGPNLTDSGTRAAPSLRYQEYTPAYADLLDNPDGISAPGPGGGYTWDGRADTLAQQPIR